MVIIYGCQCPGLLWAFWVPTRAVRGFDLPSPVEVIPFQSRAFSDDGVGDLLPVGDRKTQPWNSGRGRGLTSQATSMPLAT
jgi:hypothetical protein